tara:strand:+ start:19260 stop:20666 length:1407 start_codon:yes stop_codon:yes gene_type:complete
MLDSKLITYGFNVAFRSLLGILTIKLITQIFDVKEVGLYYIILSIIQFYNIVILNPFNSYYARNIFEYKRDNKINEASFILILFYLGCALLSLGVSFLTFDFLDLDLNLNHFIIIILTSIIISTPLRNLLQVLNSFDKILSYTFINILSISLSLVFSIILTLYFEKTISSWFFGIVLSEILTLFTLIWFIKLPLKIKVKFKRREIIKILEFSIPIIFTNIILWIQSYSYRFVIKEQFLINDVAFVTIGYSIATLLFSTIESLSGNYYKRNILEAITNYSKIKLSYIWNLTASKTIFLYVITCFFILAISKPSLYILTDNEYLNSSLKFVYLGIVVEFFRVINNQFILISNYSKKTKNRILSYSVGGVITTTFFYFFNFSSISGVFYVLIFSNVVSLVISIFSMRKLIDYKLSFGTFKIILTGLPYLGFFIFNIFYFKEDLIFNFILLSIILTYSFFIYNKNFELKTIT